VVAAAAAAPHELFYPPHLLSLYLSVTYALTRRILLLFFLLLLLPPSVGPGAAGLNEQARAIRDGTFDDAAAAAARAEAALS